MQGREDVSTADMDKLIYMFILMVKLSKAKREEDGKTLYCNDILPQLGIAPKIPATKLSLANLPAIVDDLLENDVTALVQEVEEEIDEAAANTEKETKNDSNSSMLESLTDSDLQTLLQNFKHLSSEEQHHLIAHLKKLESADPKRVEKLRKFVNISDLTGTKEPSNKSKNSDSTPTKSSSSSRSKSRFDDSPPSGSRKGRNAIPPGTEDDDDDDVDSRRRVNPNKFSLDDEDEDDDYNFEDVFKAASSNVNRLSEEHSRLSDKNTKSPIVPVSSSPSALTFNPAGLKTSFNDTQNLIANLMGSLQQSNSNSANKASSSKQTSQAMPQPVPPIDNPVAQQQQMPPQPPQPNQMAFYQQQQQQQQQVYPPGAYNQINPAQANYYNSMGGYNQNPYDGYQQWGQGPPQQMPPQNMQQFGMQGFGMPPQQMGYNMYGQGRN